MPYIFKCNKCSVERSIGECHTFNSEYLRVFITFCKKCDVKYRVLLGTYVQSEVTKIDGLLIGKSNDDDDANILRRIRGDLIQRGDLPHKIYVYTKDGKDPILKIVHIGLANSTLEGLLECLSGMNYCCKDSDLHRSIQANGIIINHHCGAAMVQSGMWMT
jgi:hypothetical protein